MRRAGSRVGVEEVSDLLLICLTFGTGAVDAISYLGLGGVFTANMTGNIVLLGLAAGKAAGPQLLRSAVSLVAFVLGLYVASRIAGRGERHRAWSAEVKIALGLEAVAQAALLAGWLAASGRPGMGLKAVLVALSGAAMGVQTGAVTALGVAGVSTTYVTGTLTSLIRGLATSTGSRRDWLRRALLLAALLVGAGCSGLLIVDARTVAPVLPLAVTLLVLAVALYVLPRSASPNP